jgi:alpha-N-arabinofuranosidase
MPTFGAWEAEVLEHTYELADYLSVHAYYEERDGDRDSFLASAVDMDALIEGVTATCDHVGARLKSAKRLRLSFDEWNVWYMSRSQAQEQEQRPWAEAPRLLEDVYSVTDAVVFGSMLITLLRHADRVAIACLAQLVNVIAPIMTEPGGPAWRQTTFFPFAQASRYGRGRVLQVHVDGPQRSTAVYGQAPLLHATAVFDDATGEVALFAVNRSQNEALPLRVELRGLTPTAVIEHSVLADADPDAKNTVDEPERVAPRAGEGTTIDAGVLTGTLPPLSWSMIRLACR